MTIQNLKSTYDSVKEPADTVNSIINLVKLLNNIRGKLIFDLRQIDKIIAAIDKATILQYLSQDEVTVITENIKTLKACVGKLTKIR